MDAVGRKLGFIIAQSASLVGWIIVASSFDVVTVCVGRFIGGAASAATTLIGKKVDHKNLFFKLSNLACPVWSSEKLASVQKVRARSYNQNYSIDFDFTLELTN